MLKPGSQCMIAGPYRNIIGDGKFYEVVVILLAHTIGVVRQVITFLFIIYLHFHIFVSV